MRKTISLFLFLLSAFNYTQTDYSDSWVDFYSYNNVKDFIIANDLLCVIFKEVIESRTTKIAIVN